MAQRVTQKLWEARRRPSPWPWGQGHGCLHMSKLITLCMVSRCSTLCEDHTSIKLQIQKGEDGWSGPEEGQM